LLGKAGEILPKLYEEYIKALWMTLAFFFGH
jgi:hypothetical protein